MSTPTTPLPAPRTTEVAPYDAILLLSFGGPEAMEEVMPFLRRVVAGRGVPDERLEAVAEHYYAVGGRSPINEENRRLIADLTDGLAQRGIEVPVLWGNRNAEPYAGDALREAAGHGIHRLVTIPTSAYSSYSSCRQYREDLASAVTGAGADIVVDKVRPFADHPAFGETATDLLATALEPLLAQGHRPHVLFVTHSIPLSMNATSGPPDGPGGLYQRQHEALADGILRRIADRLDATVDGELVYCSRSGSPHQPWLEPDVNDRLEELAAAGTSHVVLQPVGFVSDHMEVVHDLDVEAAATCERLGLPMVRVPTAGRDRRFVAGLVDLVLERAAEARGEAPDHPVWPSMEQVGPRPSTCPAGCCPNPRAPRPALCGRD